jgi:hypothetical protein
VPARRISCAGNGPGGFDLTIFRPACWALVAYESLPRSPHPWAPIMAARLGPCVLVALLACVPLAVEAQYACADCSAPKPRLLQFCDEVVQPGQVGPHARPRGGPVQTLLRCAALRQLSARARPVVQKVRAAHRSRPLPVVKP